MLKTSCPVLHYLVTCFLVQCPSSSVYTSGEGIKALRRLAPFHSPQVHPAMTDSTRNEHVSKLTIHYAGAQIFQFTICRSQIHPNPVQKFQSPDPAPAQLQAAPDTVQMCRWHYK